MAHDHFGERVAERYDESSTEMFEPAAVDPVVDFLAELAGGGAALELGIGTGRIALPLAQRGVRVHGIDLSTAMVTRLRAKPGGEDIDVTIGDFATTTIEGTFSVVYLVFNTIMNLTTQDEQVACFQNVARHLGPGGCFVVEVGVPDLQRLPRGEAFRPFKVTPTRLGFDEYDVVTQGLISHHYAVVDGKLEVLSPPFRYVWPSELDLMARIAGMTLRERWSGWKREPFTSDSTKHVSVWEKPASPSRIAQMNVSLRPLEDRDLDTIYRQVTDPESVRMAAFTAEDQTDRRAFLNRMSRVRADTSVSYRVIDVDGAIAGTIASFRVDNRPEVTYWVDRTQWGKGIASAALQILLAENAERPLYARAASDNVGSLRVLEKAGFRRVGVNRDFAPGRGEEIEETILRLD